jgi:hypothetical protein
VEYGPEALWARNAEISRCSLFRLWPPIKGDERMTDDAGQNYDEAIALKERVANDGVSSSGGNPRWFHSVVDDPKKVESFLNTNPAQGPGEASVTNRADGKVDVYWFVANAAA